LAKEQTPAPEFAPIFDVLSSAPPISETPLAEVRALWDLGAMADSELLATVRADNEVTCLHYEALPHGFFNYLIRVRMAAEAAREIVGLARQRLECATALQHLSQAMRS